MTQPANLGTALIFIHILLFDATMQITNEKLATEVIEGLKTYSYDLGQRDKERQEQLLFLLSELRKRAGYVDIDELHDILQPITQNREPISWLLTAMEFYVKKRIDDCL